MNIQLIIYGNEGEFYHCRMGEPYQSALCCFYDCHSCRPFYPWVVGETKATLQEPANLAAASGSALAGLLLAEMQSRVKDLMKDQQNAWKHDQAGYRTKTLDACRSVATSLAKVPPEEGLAYKKWVLAIGLKVAEAAKENGVAVSDPEKAALEIGRAHV